MIISSRRVKLLLLPRSVSPLLIKAETWHLWSRRNCKEFKQLADLSFCPPPLMLFMSDSCYTYSWIPARSAGVSSGHLNKWPVRVWRVQDAHKWLIPTVTPSSVHHQKYVDTNIMSFSLLTLERRWKGERFTSFGINDVFNISYWL